MTAPWYAKWEGGYLCSEDERKSFLSWYNDRQQDGKIDPDDVEDDLLNQYRDTQVWTDSFLDWAWHQEYPTSL